MERIGSPGDVNFRKKLQKDRKRTESGQGTQAVFQSILAEEKEGIDDSGLSAVLSTVPGGSLETLLDALHEEGERLKEHPTMQNIKRYRETVKKFLAYVVKNSLETETVEGSKFNPIKKQKKYILIKVIDRKLETLAAGIMQNQRDQLDILRKVDEINGLVVDLLS